MNTQIGVGVAVLSALAAEGKDFDRGELNAMLDKLASSPEPKVRIGPSAMCYSPCIPEASRFECICRKCGTHTVYPKNSRDMKNKLARYRDGAASLRALGLDIRLDESALCRKCRSAKELGVRTHAKIVVEPTLEGMRPDPRWKKGETVEVRAYGADYCQIHKIRQIGPEDLAPQVVVVNTGGSKKKLVAEPPDRKFLDRIESDETTIRTECLGDFTYEEDDKASIGRFEKLAWVINGRRTVVRDNYDYDIRILKAFLTGKETWSLWDDDKYQVPLKDELLRLRELLGPAGGSGGSASKCEPGEVAVVPDNEPSGESPKPLPKGVPGEVAVEVDL